MKNLPKNNNKKGVWNQEEFEKWETLRAEQVRLRTKRNKAKHKRTSKFLTESELIEAKQRIT